MAAIQTNYQKHLYFEENTNSKEFALSRYISVLGMIAQLRDRNQAILESCETLYGRNENGKVIAPSTEVDMYDKHHAMIKRLKNYYNFCLSRLTIFNT